MAWDGIRRVTNFMNAVDTNVYVYALDADEAAKQAKAIELFDRLTLQRADTVLIWQVAVSSSTSCGNGNCRGA
jgi:predicted nucleic acid-binding protein